MEAYPDHPHPYIEFPHIIIDINYEADLLTNI